MSLNWDRHGVLDWVFWDLQRFGAKNSTAKGLATVMDCKVASGQSEECVSVTTTSILEDLQCFGAKNNMAKGLVTAMDQQIANGQSEECGSVTTTPKSRQKLRLRTFRGKEAYEDSMKDTVLQLFGRPGQTGIVSIALGDVIVLHSPCLIDALARLFMKVAIQVMVFEAPSNLQQDPKLYKSTAVLTRSLLRRFWKEYTDEKQFLLAMCLHMLLMSRYYFYTGQANVLENLDNDYVLVPAIQGTTFH